MKQLEAVVVRLEEVGNLPVETESDVLEGLTICSVEAFKKMFDHLLQQEKIAMLQLSSPTTSALEQVRQIIRQANDLYHRLNTSNQWHVH